MSDKFIPKTPCDHTIEQIKAIRPIVKFIGFFNRNVREKFREIEQQLENVNQLKTNLDTFIKIYAPLGWVNYDRLSTEIVAMVLTNCVEDGEVFLTQYHLDPNNLRFLGYRFHTPYYEPWNILYERAVERAIAEDFLSSVLIVLSIIDGICTSSTGKHPFSGGADMPVFDSQASGPGGLAEGLALLGSTRRKLDSGPISIPFRHGIVHGLNPNYGSPLVAAKAFNLLQAMIDYFDRRRDEAERLGKAAKDQKPIDLSELIEKFRRNNEFKRTLDEWRARPAVLGVTLASSNDTKSLVPGTPETSAAEYLVLLTAKNYGGLAKATIDYPKRTIGYRAGRLREELNEVIITRWAITGVEDTAPAISKVMIRLEGELDGKVWCGDRTMRLLFADENYDPIVRGHSSGVWVVMPDFLSGLYLLANNPEGNVE